MLLVFGIENQTTLAEVFSAPLELTLLEVIDEHGNQPSSQSSVLFEAHAPLDNSDPVLAPP